MLDAVVIAKLVSVLLENGCCVVDDVLVASTNGIVPVFKEGTGSGAAVLSVRVALEPILVEIAFPIVELCDPLVPRLVTLSVGKLVDTSAPLVVGTNTVDWLLVSTVVIVTVMVSTAGLVVAIGGTELADMDICVMPTVGPEFTDTDVCRVSTGSNCATFSDMRDLTCSLCEALISKTKINVPIVIRRIVNNTR